MGLLQEAAEYEERHWKNYLGGLRSQGARDYLTQLGRAVLLVLLLALLADGARRDLSHGSASVVALTGGATLQPGSGKTAPAPSFIGQSFRLSDTLTTQNAGSITLAFPDGSVVRLGPASQLRLTQSDAFRNGRRTRTFQLLTGSLQVLADTDTETTVLTAQGATSKRGSFTLGSGLAGTSSSGLQRHALRPPFFAGLERAVWWPLDALLNRLGVSARGTLIGTDSQRLDDALKVGKAIQQSLPSAYGITTGIPLPIEQTGLSGLSAESFTLTQRCVAGPLVRVKKSGADFAAELQVRDSAGSRLQITPKGILRLGPVRL